MQILDEIKKVHSQLLQNGNYGQIAHLKHLHDSSLSAFEKQGIPSTKHEEWKYVNLLELNSKTYTWSPEISIDTQFIKKHKIADENGIHLILLDGTYRFDLSSIKHQKGLKIHNLSTFLQENGAQALQERFGKIDTYNNDGILAMQYALTWHGVYIEIQKNTVLESPIYIYHLHTTEGVLSTPRVLIDAQPNSQATIIELFESESTANTLFNGATEFRIAQDTKLKYNRVIKESTTAIHLGTVQCNMAGKGVFNATTVVLDGHIIRNNLNIQLNASYAEVHLYGLNILHGQTTTDHHTVVDHIMPNCPSNELYKSVLDDASTSIFNGKIYVQPNAQKTNAYQSSKSILLSNRCSSNSKPQLEIWADDVKCSHGHATGQLDKEALFYLKSRGISEKEAVSILTKAFAQDVIYSIDNTWVREKIEKELDNRFLTI